MTEEELLNQNVVVLCNIKSKKLGGYPSHGMILCSSIKTDGKESQIETLIPPPDSLVKFIITLK